MSGAKGTGGKCTRAAPLHWRRRVWRFGGVPAASRIEPGGQGVPLRRRAERERLAATEEAARDLRAQVAEVSQRVAEREAILGATPDGIVLFGGDEHVVYANPAARDLLGRRFERAAELSPEALRRAVRSAFRANGPAETSFETGGRAISARAVGAGDDGAVVLVARDVTAERRLDRIRRDFVANASHELKTPVASILALAETLSEAAGEDLEAARHFLSRLEQEANRLSRLVGDLLDLSRLEGEAGERSVVDLGEVVVEEAERLRARAEAAGIRLVVETPEPVRVSGSRGDLGLLVHNLLDNAIQYSPDGGEVRAVVRIRDERAELRVSDTGIGIPSRDLDRVFERFYRADPARSRATGGTGLGLSIVRHVAESHGGDVSARSVLGAGSTFIVRLPAFAG
jgi:two-component system, OmpR family, sensor histidine kinase SenX3